MKARPRPERSAAWFGLSPRTGACVGYAALATLLFSQPLARLLAHAVESELHSYIPLVPLITGYLLYTRRRPEVTEYRSSIGGAVLLGAIGLTALTGAISFHGTLSVNDELSLWALAFVSVVGAGGFLFLGSTWMAGAAFPIGFLIFMVPLPDGAVSWLEMASVRGSAEVAAWFFKATGTPLLRDGTVFAIPGIVMEVARECSGIRSSLVLFITSLVASHLFLESPWRRVMLVVFVIPLGIVRNGFRILVIGLLCVHIGPHMIDSVIHHRGGPLFFVLSLGPLFLLLWLLRRRDRRVQPLAIAAVRE